MTFFLKRETTVFLIYPKFTFQVCHMIKGSTDQSLESIDGHFLLGNSGQIL